METKHIIYWVGALVALGLVIWYFTASRETLVEEPAPVVLSFEACAAAGYPVMESYPRQCMTPDGRNYTEELPVEEFTYVNADDYHIQVENPTPGSVTGKQFSVVGIARGNWFFEASFPIEISDTTGTVIATGIAQAEGEWMTTGFVPFKADITIPDSFMGKAIVVLKKDNPSGMPENDASISYPITIEY